jgi:hypothetical protein
MRRFLAARRGSFRPVRLGVVVGLVLLAVIAIAVIPTPRASASLSDYKNCFGHLNVYGTRGQELTLEHKATWDTDVWKQAPSERFKVVLDGSYQSHWQSESGYVRGCHATVRYRWPGGSAEFSMTFYFDGRASVACFPSGDVRSCDGTIRALDHGVHQDLHVDWHLVLP